jgi:cytochrome c553
MKKATLVLVGLAIASTTINPALAKGDAAAGKAKAAICGACHGMTGTSPNDLWPNLAGQKQGYLAKQIKAFRDGDRKEAMMSPMAAGLSDDDIDNLAAYFSSQKAE